MFLRRREIRLPRHNLHVPTGRPTSIFGFGYVARSNMWRHQEIENLPLQDRPERNEFRIVEARGAGVQEARRQGARGVAAANRENRRGKNLLELYLGYECNARCSFCSSRPGAEAEYGASRERDGADAARGFDAWIGWGRTDGARMCSLVRRGAQVFIRACTPTGSDLRTRAARALASRGWTAYVAIHRIRRASRRRDRSRALSPKS